jgi:hypothetical protein
MGKVNVLSPPTFLFKRDSNSIATKVGGGNGKRVKTEGEGMKEVEWEEE